jgi:hypothetical protein
VNSKSSQIMWLESTLAHKNSLETDQILTKSWFRPAALNVFVKDKSEIRLEPGSLDR